MKKTVLVLSLLTAFNVHALDFKINFSGTATNTSSKSNLSSQQISSCEKANKNNRNDAKECMDKISDEMEIRALRGKYSQVSYKEVQFFKLKKENQPIDDNLIADIYKSQAEKLEKMKHMKMYSGFGVDELLQDLLKIAVQPQSLTKNYPIDPNRVNDVNLILNNTIQFANANSNIGPNSKYYSSIQDNIKRLRFYVKNPAMVVQSYHKLFPQIFGDIPLKNVTKSDCDVLIGMGYEIMIKKKTLTCNGL